MSMIGKGGVAKKKKSGSTPHSGKTLQRLGFGEQGSRLVLQLLDTPQGSTSGLAPGQISVWVQKAEVPDEGSSMAVCTWPPREVVISGGTTPSFGHLRRPVAATFDLPLPPMSGGAGSNNLQFYKYAPETFSWTELLPGLNNMKKKGGRGQSENILSPPYNLKDGSFLTLRVSAVKKSTGTSVGTKQGNGSGVDRREDMFLRFLKEVAAEEKRARRAHGRVSGDVDFSPGFSNTGGTVRKETSVMLRIGDLNLNFSDDDDDNSV